MKIKIPREFKIGAAQAKLFLQPHLKGDDGYNGTYNRRTGELCLDNTLGGHFRDRIFGHELNEVIKANYEIEFTEESMSCVANGWLEFLWQLGIEFDWSDIEERIDEPD